MSKETVTLCAKQGKGENCVRFNLRIPKEQGDKMAELQKANPEKYAPRKLEDGTMEYHDLDLVHDAADALQAEK